MAPSTLDTKRRGHTIMSALRTTLIALCFLVLVPGCGSGTDQQARNVAPDKGDGDRIALDREDDDKGDDEPKKPRGKFTISKETTWVTEPLDEAGYIDYAAALNKRLREGVTPENNANVLLWKAHGPHPDGETTPSGYFEAMGIKAPPERGEYFIDLIQYLKEHHKTVSNVE